MVVVGVGDWNLYSSVFNSSHESELTQAIEVPPHWATVALFLHMDRHTTKTNCCEATSIPHRFHVFGSYIMGHGSCLMRHGPCFWPWLIPEYYHVKPSLAGKHSVGTNLLKEYLGFKSPLAEK